MDMKIYEIPLNERTKLCSILDENNAWLELANKWEFESSQIQVSPILNYFTPRRVLVTHPNFPIFKKICF